LPTVVPFGADKIARKIRLAPRKWIYNCHDTLAF
jgi:hypothetical protein